MDKETIIRKLTSRKLWVALAGFVAGLYVALGGTAETAETVSGLIMSGASVLGYLLAEGLTDAAEAGAPLDVTIKAVKAEPTAEE